MLLDEGLNDQLNQTLHEMDAHKKSKTAALESNSTKSGNTTSLTATVNATSTATPNANSNLSVKDAN